MELNTDYTHLTGAEKAAILMMCLPKGKGAPIMRELGDDDTRALVKAITTLGMVPPQAVERVIREFADAMLGRGGLSGSAEIARSLLADLMPGTRVSEIMEDISAPQDNRSFWDEVSALNEQVIANHLRPEQDQMIAVVLSKMKPQAAAAVLPHFGAGRMADIITRMISLDNLHRQVVQDIEEAISSELLSSATRKSGSDSHGRLAEMFNKMEPDVFKDLSAVLDERAPQVFGQIKKKMFVFDDLIRMDPQSLQRIIRSCESGILPLALKGARKEVRDAFMAPEVMTQRSRDTLQQDMDDLGMIRARKAREAQNRILEITFDLVRQDVIRLPTDEEQMIE